MGKKEDPAQKCCPVCKRQPKIKYEYIPCGCFVTIRCKPLFRKEHLSVTHGAALEERAYMMATQDWNKAADLLKSAMEGGAM